MPLRHFNVCLFSVFILVAQAQSYNDHAFNQLDSLPDLEKVRYVNQHYYTLYSADFDRAYTLLESACDLSLKNDWLPEAAYAHLYWGVVTYLMGRYEEVQPKYFRALELFERQGDKQGVAATHNELAIFYNKVNDIENCFRSLDMAEKIAREINDLERLGTNLGHRGFFLSSKGKYAEAKPYFLEVYKIRLELKDSVGLGYILLDLAEIAAAEKDLLRAEQKINESIELRKKIRDHYGVAVSTLAKGKIYTTLDRFDEGVKWLQAGLTLARQVGYHDLRKDAYHQLANAYVQHGDYRNALVYREREFFTRDSLMSLEKAKAISELQERYESEKKEHQLAEQQLLLQQNRWLIVCLVVVLLLLVVVALVWRRNLHVRQQQALAETQSEFQATLTEAVISLQERERARIAKDLHDGFGQYISVVQLYLAKTQERWKQDANDLLNQMHKEVRNIAFDLLPHTLVNAGLATALRELAGRLNLARQAVIQLHTTESERLDSTLEVSLYRVCQEWINNILKYASATTIKISLVYHEDELSLIIEDDGDGFDLELLAKSTGNGWRNIQSRVQLHKGSVFVESTAGRKGNSLLVDVPLHRVRRNVA